MDRNNSGPVPSPENLGILVLVRSEIGLVHNPTYIILLFDVCMLLQVAWINSSTLHLVLFNLKIFQVLLLLEDGKQNKHIISQRKQNHQSNKNQNQYTIDVRCINIKFNIRISSYYFFVKKIKINHFFSTSTTLSVHPSSINSSTQPNQK